MEECAGAVGLREGRRAAVRVHEAQSQPSRPHMPKESRHSEKRAVNVLPWTEHGVVEEVFEVKGSS
jgi:hypothetical protein